MKKDKEWLKEEINKVTSRIYGADFNTIKETDDLIDQLDEPEITEEQAWEVIERANHYHIAPSDVWKYKEAIQKGLTLSGISKPELPVIPQFVASAIEDAKENRKNITILNIFNEVTTSGFYTENVDNWILNNPDVFARAWLDGYTVEKEKQYRVKVGEKLYFSGYEEIIARFVIDNAPGRLEEAYIYYNFKHATNCAKEIGGVVKEVSE